VLDIKVDVAAACLLCVVVPFQFALAAGAPWGAAAYGGRDVQDDGRLPTRYRVAGAGTAVLLTGALWLVLAAARVITTTAPSASLQGVGSGHSWGFSRSIQWATSQGDTR
jgi:hypothetical protein